ncbi:MAG TPA: glycoside hydrolase, partial [Rugosimonospora sp.]
MKKLIIIAVSVAVAVIGLPVLLAAAVLGGGSGGCPTMFANMAEPAAATWDEEQLDNAAIIVDVGVTRGVPQWGRVIAVATAMQESGLRNLPDLGPGNDHDSIGLFQQRPSQGWGTPSQLADPRYQAGKFYDKLLTIPNWPQLPLA